MKTIIAGTDFTPSSINACMYAALMATKLNCRLTLFNMFEAPLMHSNIGLYGLSYLALRKSSEKKTGLLTEEIKQQFPELKINTFVTSGNFRDELENFTRIHQVEAAVMGLEVKTWISKSIYGSHGVNIAGKIETPVIIVPQKYKKHELDNILLAVDNTEKLKKSSLSKFENFVKSSKVKLKLLHVRSKDELFNPKIEDLKINGKLLSIEQIKAKDLQTGIKSYCKIEPADLICIISKKHSVFYNLYAESNTNKVAFSSNIPVMAIHE